MPKMGVRRLRQILVGQFGEYQVDRIGPAGEVGSDHLDGTLWANEIVRPRQVETPLHVVAAGRPHAGVPVLADDDVSDLPVDDLRKTDETLPAAPACRL